MKMNKQQKIPEASVEYPYASSRNAEKWQMILLISMILILALFLGSIALGNITGSIKYVSDDCPQYKNTPLKDIPGKCVKRFM